MFNSWLNTQVLFVMSPKKWWFISILHTQLISEEHGSPWIFGWWNGEIPTVLTVRSPCLPRWNPHFLPRKKSQKLGAWDSSLIKVFNCSTEAWRKSTATQRYWWKYIIYIQYMNIQFYLYTYDIIWIHMICTCICPSSVSKTVIIPYLRLKNPAHINSPFDDDRTYTVDQS